MSRHQFAPLESGYLKRPIRDLGLRIAGSWLEPIVNQFLRELEKAGIRRLRPDLYLSTEWGVVPDTISLAIPFYLAHPELTKLHEQRVGHVEGVSKAETLRYLRHEMGHVVNYAYRLYEQEDWVKCFGSITQPYTEDYRPEQFSRRFVDHLPGWYAQMHPDEDWSETFAVWMTPGLDWRKQYAGRRDVLGKLRYCERIMSKLGDIDPVVAAVDADEKVDDISYTLEEFYQKHNPDVAGPQPGEESLPPGMDGAIRSIFEGRDAPEDLSTNAPRPPASQLILKLKVSLMADVYRWTGHFPERTKTLVENLAKRADQLNQVYPEDREEQATVALTTLVTALAMNFVYRGSYAP